MKKLLVHNGFFRLLAPLFCGVIIYLLILLLNNDVSNLSELFNGQEVYVCIGISYLVLEGLRLLSLTFEKHIKSIYILVFASVIASILITTISASSYFNFILEFSISDSQLMIFNIAFAAVSLLYNLLFISQVFLRKQNKNRLMEERLLTQSLESEFNQFKNEVNPELLYDSLETLISLTHKNVEETEDYIDQLSYVYRYILSHRKVEFVTIREDVKASEAIIYLLQNNNQKSIYLEVNLEDNYLESLIIPGTLPNLIEQIIRTTIISNIAPLSIIISFDEEGYIVIEHKMNDRLNHSNRNIKTSIQDSYAIYSDKPFIEISAYGVNYLKIPVLEVENTSNQRLDSVNS